MSEEKDSLVAYLESNRQTMERITAALDRRAALLSPSNTTTTQNTTIDAGSKFIWLGLWLSITCCLVMFVMCWKQTEEIDAMRAQWLESARKQEANSDRLSILLQWAPNLRDEVNREMDKRKTK